MTTQGRDILSSLRRVSLFAGLTDESLMGIAHHCRRRSYPAGAPLFYEHDPGHSLFIIQNGTVIIEKESGRDDGTMIFLAERGPGDVIGEMALFDQEPRSATVIARTVCEALSLDRDSFLRFVQQEPTVAVQIIAMLSQRLRESGRQAARKVSLDALGRLAAFLLEQADQQKTPTPAAAGPRRTPRLTDRDVGERIGATRETVSRKMSRLTQMRAIRCEDGHVLLLDERRLRTLSGDNP